MLLGPVGDGSSGWNGMLLGPVGDGSSGWNGSVPGPDGAGSSGWNGSALERGLDSIAALALDPSFALLLAALVAAAAWAVYGAFYEHRLLGRLLTAAANRFYFSHHNFRIGSVSVAALAGKLMFRDLVYVGYDYSLRVQDGYVIFRWWRAYVPKDVSEDLSHSDTRLSLVLNGLELHVYNRCALYTALEAAFGLEPRVQGAARAGAAPAGPPAKPRAAAGAGDAALARTWRDLIPVVKADVSMARVVLGNRLVPSALALSAEEARLTYSTKPAACALDLRMHFVKGAADNVKLLLAPSPGYTARHDEPPRYMGEGFVVMSSSRVELYAYMDEPGAVPAHPVLLRLANGDVAEGAPPLVGLDLKVGKGTDFSYGPWADRQRDHLHRLFFPPSHEPLEVTPPPAPGQRRQAQAFDFRLSTLNEATLDVLFSKRQETSAVHVNVGAGSYLEVSVPWAVGAEGCVTRVSGQLLHVDASTSLASRPLAECETLEFSARAHYPRHFNHPQRWTLALTGCKATVHFLYAHIPFFADLVQDWAGGEPPDLLRFVPYTWTVSLLLKEFELLTLTNEHNWVDCGSTNQENRHVAVCGDLLDLSVELPFEDFLPPTTRVTVWAQGEGVAAALLLPESSAQRPTLLALAAQARLPAGGARGARWRRRCGRAPGWVDCWHVPLVALSVAYRYHGPSPPAGPEPQADITTPEKEELLLSPMRFGRAAAPAAPPHAPRRPPPPPAERAALPPDTVALELEVGPSEMVAYGTLLHHLSLLLDNVFGDDQEFTDMARGGGGGGAERSEGAEEGGEGGAVARPLQVAVAVTLHDVRASLPRARSEGEPPCPLVLVERVAFEMDKGFDQTRLQLVLSPAQLELGCSGGGEAGRVALAALQLRGHGLHSEAGRAPHQDTVEYAWMLELTLGRLTGRLSVPQLYHLATAAEMFALLLGAAEDGLEPARGERACHHGRDPARCPHGRPQRPCPPGLAMRYRMVRLVAEPAELWLGDGCSALRLRVAAVRAGWCNLPGAACAGAASLLLPRVCLALLVQPGGAGEWLRAARLALGPLLLEAAEAPDGPETVALHTKFLRLHDRRSRRLWFLWGDSRCGCQGGCAFFGSDRNGATLFRPSAAEAAAGVNATAYRVLAPPELGFGQSLLHAGALVFRTPPYCRGLQPAPPSPPPPPPPAPAPPPPPPRSRGEVPYSRLRDARTDSDSRLHRAALDVPPLESSVSDSRLAGPGRRSVHGSRSRHSLGAGPGAGPGGPKRAASVSSEPPSEVFVSLEERDSGSGADAGAGAGAGAEDAASLSNASFVSALSSQEEAALVRLRAPASRPIADSPLLLAGYARALPRYRRVDRAAPASPPPLVERAACDGPLQYVGHRLLPTYRPLGGPRYRLAAAARSGDGDSDGGAAPPAVRPHPLPPAWWDALGAADDGAAWGEDVGVSVRLRGDAELTVCPLALEAAQRACEALTPALAAAHPAAVLAALRRRCVAAVRRASPLQTGGRCGAAPALEYEVSRRVRWAAAVPGVALLLLQAGVEEPAVSPERAPRPAGVSLLSARLAALRAGGAATRRALHSLRRRPSPRAARRPPPLPRGAAPAGSSRGPHPPPPLPPDAPALYLETAAPLLDDVTVTVDLGSLHSSLRRLRSEGDGPVTVTAVPASQARANFTVLQVEESGDADVGYIVAECGLEGAALRLRRGLAEPRREPETEPEPEHEPGPGPPPAARAQLDARLVWLHFAAPPRSGAGGRAGEGPPPAGLLTTVPPAITAWLNPANRLGIRAVAAHRALGRRAAATAACLMAAALDGPVPRAAAAARHPRHSAAARRLRAEPSLQLLAALGRTLLATDGAALAADLAPRHVPPLAVLRRALVVLARQWSALLAAPLPLLAAPPPPPPLSVTFAPDLAPPPPPPDDCSSESDHLLHTTHAHPLHDHLSTATEDPLSSGSGSCGGDLYAWMAAQEGGPSVPPRAAPPLLPAAPPPARGGAASLRPLRGAPLLLDAHAAFAPLLRALGVRASAAAAPSPAAAARLELQGALETLRVHLAGAGAGEGAGEDPALLLQALALGGDARQVADGAVEELVRRQDVLYISRSQLRQHFSTMINFDLSVRFISQQVNMPLLRLLHQISGMYSSVREAQTELRGQSPTRARDHGSDASECRDTLVSESSLEREPQYWTLGSSGGWEGGAAAAAPPRPPAAPPAAPRPPRPQSLAQRLRSTGKSVRGRLGMAGGGSGGAVSADSYSALEPGGAGAGAGGRTPPPAPQQLSPRCWRTVRLLLELYANMADADSVAHRFSVRAHLPPAPAAAAPPDHRPPSLVIVGIVKVERARVLAALSGLQLEAQLTALGAAPSATLGRQWALSVTAGGAVGALLEGGGAGAVLRAELGPWRALASRALPRPAQLLVSLGAVRADLPQHPVALHGVVTRSSRQLSSTLHELGVGRAAHGEAEPSPPPAAAAASPRPLPRLRFQLAVSSVALTAALLPSLQAQYRMEAVSSAGETGPETHFTVELPSHSLGFAARRAAAGAGAGLPAAALVSLPAVHVAGRVRDEPEPEPAAAGAEADEARLRAGRYLHAIADVGLFEHTLSTDLLNHLVFVQKVFMREVNEVVQKVWGGRGGGEPGGGRQSEGGAARGAAGGRLLLALTLRVRRVALTATTPSSCAVRLEASALQLELSNRAANAPAPAPTPAPAAAEAPPERPLFARAQLDLNLSLGQLIRNAMFEEAEPEFQQYAFFKTRITVRNALAEEQWSGGQRRRQREVAVIAVRRPLVCVQPVAVDKAVLVYLSYKSAYDYWAEERRALAAEVRHATQRLLEAVTAAAGAAPPAASALLLRLDVDEAGVCLPLGGAGTGGGAGAGAGGEPAAAVVLTLDSSSVSACASAALACRGRFVGLCLRFAPEFEASLDDWRPRADEPALNVCCVSEGTYEVCSRTEAAGPNENAKWFLNVSWQMEGVDMQLDVRVGGLLSALGQTLTALTGEEPPVSAANAPAPAPHGHAGPPPQDLPAPLLDHSLDARARSKLLEHEMSEQAKIIADLRALGASHATVELELRRLQELEALAFQDFRRDMLQRLRRPSARAAPLSAPPLSVPPDPDARLADILEGASWSSVDSDPPASTPPSTQGPSRSASLRSRAGPGAGVGAGPGVQRQSSLPAGAGAWGGARGAVELRRDQPPPPEPNVDLRLDVRVHVSSGQCVLHTAGAGAGGSPGARRRGGGGVGGGTARDASVFRVPGLALAVHYESRAEPQRPAAKRAKLYAWLTLQRIPEETLVSPHILDFLEQALEPLGAPAPPAVPSVPTVPADSLAYASFPVDVVVHVHLQPVTFRFSCLPASRVECLLRLPALRLVFSSSDDGGLGVTGCLDDFSVNVFHPYGGHRAAAGSGAVPHQPPARKDSLSINVEFVKFHLARSRRQQHARTNTVRFSTIVDIGAACFKYDMRRLGEILAFPRAWYRRAIVRRLFLGDTAAPAPVSAPAPAPPLSAPPPPPPPPPADRWETLVLFAVNFTKLSVHMNMGNVMGNVGWHSAAFGCWGRLSIGSSGHRNMRVAVALRSSALDARGGIVGGALSLADIHTYVHVVRSAGGGMPRHAAGLRLGAAELRAEYMGGAALLARASRLQARARDQWPPRRAAPPSPGPGPGPAPAVLAHATLQWHQLQLLMSRSTTPDLLKMQLKLEEFFTQQFKSGRRVISALHPELRRRAPHPPTAAAPPPPWARARRLLPPSVPARAVVGGTMELHGAHVSLACFHGASFKAKSWALFSLKDPCVSFTTEVQQEEQGAPHGPHAVQGLTVTLGPVGGTGGTGGTAGGGGVGLSVGTVCRMSRSSLFPPQLRSLHDWFGYAFAGSDLDAIDSFPSLEPSSGARPPDRHLREVIFALPPLQLHLRTQHSQQRTDPAAAPVHTVECSFITEFEDHIFVSVDAEAFLFLHDLIASYLKEKARVAPAPGPGPTQAPGGSGGSRAGPVPADPRVYRCVTWHLEPTVRLLAWAGKSIEPYGVDYILQKLGFSHARTTIPKWVQRGALDPLDRVLAAALRRLLRALPPDPDHDPGVDPDADPGGDPDPRATD